MTTFLSKKNNALSKVATVGGIDNSTDPVTFAVTTGEGTKFPASNFNISIDNEILLCTSRTGDNLTCARAKESTVIAAHSQNADVENRITSGQLVELEAAINNFAISSKVITATRDLTSASGDVSYTGVGFTPSSILVLVVIDTTLHQSIGFADSAKTGACISEYDGTMTYAANLIRISNAVSNFQYAIVKSYDADGFTLTWTKYTAPTGTAHLRFICFR